MVRVQNSKKSGGGGGGKSAKIGGVKKSGMQRRRGGGGSSGGGGKIVDARMKIIAKNRSKVVDARDKLVKLAKGTDARQKLQKIRNLKEGKLDVKTTSKGGITITTTTQGKLLLTTSKKSGSANVNKKSPMAANKKMARDALRQTAGGGIGGRNRNRGSGPIRNNLTSASKLNDSHRGFRSDVGHQRRSDSGDRRPQTFRRSRSPVRVQASSRHQARPFDYDDPRRAMEREEDVYRKRFQHEPEHDLYRGRTLADRVLETGGNHTSPLQGTKVIVTNLLPTVTQEDIAELFSDVGPLKRAKVTTPGTAEVVYINYNDAQRAIDVYHNRQLDGRSMKCQIVGQSGTVSESKLSSLYRSSGAAEGPSPDLTAIHKALFSDKRRPMGSGSGSRTHFSVTVSNKKGSRNYY